MTPRPKKLAAKLAKIMASIDVIVKNGRNEHFGYDYVTEADILSAVRTKLAEEKIFVLTSTEKEEIRTTVLTERKTFKDGNVIETQKTKQLTIIGTLHTFVDGETGEQFVVRGHGQGEDAGDKGGYKAMTGAMKYMLLKTFMIATGDDPEATDGEGRKTEQKQEAHVPPPAAPAPISRGQRKMLLEIWADLMIRKNTDPMKRGPMLAATLNQRYQTDSIDRLTFKQAGDMIDATIAAIEKTKQTTATMGAPVAPSEAIVPPAPSDSPASPSTPQRPIAEVTADIVASSPFHQ